MEVITFSQPLDVQIKEFKSWLESETTDILKPLNEECRKIVDKVKERLEDAHDVCEKLAEEASRQIEKGKAVRKAKVTEKLSRYFLKQIDKVVFQDEMSFSNVDKLYKELQRTFSVIVRERNTWFPRISPLFIIARKKVDFAFSRLAGSISDLDAFLSKEYLKAQAVEELFSETDEITRLLDDLARYEKRIATIKEKLKILQRRIEERERKIESTKCSGDLDDLAEISQRIQKLKKQLKYDLRHLEKPLLKFANLTRTPGFALNSEEVEKLSQCLEDPFLALATEKPSCPILKGILKKVERAMDEGKLKLKSSRLRKAREEIEAILNQNELDNIQKNCIQAFSLNKQLTSSEETQIARKRIEQSRRRLEVLRKRKEAAAARLEILEKEHKKLHEKAEKQKSMLEKSVNEALAKRVNLQF